MAKAYWWKGADYPNLGDELTDIILRERYEKTLDHSVIGDADLAATGSLLGWALDERKMPADRRPLHIVGSGFMSMESAVSPLPYTRIHSVRGYLSKNKLGACDSWKISVGDPGLLAPLIMGSVERKESETVRYGVVLHHKHAGNEEVKNRFRHLDAKFIDIRTSDLATFVNDIQTCDIVVSQSLHGLIIADAIGVPNVWLELGPIHSGGTFKFLDYFSSVGREAYKKLSGVPKNAALIDAAVFQSDRARVSALQGQIDRAFVEALAQIEGSCPR